MILITWLDSTTIFLYIAKFAIYPSSVGVWKGTRVKTIKAQENASLAMMKGAISKEIQLFL